MTPSTWTRRLAGMAALATAAMVLPACTEESAGTPASAPAGHQGPSATPANVFAGLEACDLLRPITNAQGFEPPQPEDYESENGCGAEKPRYGGVSLYLVDKAGIADVKPTTRGGHLTDTQIGGRDARQLAGDGDEGACYIAISVTNTARATVGEVIGGTTQQACQDTRAIAEQVAPKLPRG